MSKKSNAQEFRQKVLNKIIEQLDENDEISKAAMDVALTGKPTCLVDGVMQYLRGIIVNADDKKKRDTMGHFLTLTTVVMCQRWLDTVEELEEVKDRRNCEITN